MAHGLESCYDREEERQREKERAAREGEHYKAPEVRQKEAQLAKAQFQVQFILLRYEPQSSSKLVRMAKRVK